MRAVGSVNVVSRAQPPNRFTVPPGRGHRHGQLPRLRAADGLDHEVGAAGALDVLRALRWRRIVSAAPKRRASLSRSGCGSSTTGQPPALATSAHSIDARATRRRGSSRGRRGGRRTTSIACTAHASGSASGASASGTPGGQRVEVHARDPLRHEQLLGEAAEHVEQVLAQALAPARALAADRRTAPSCRRTRRRRARRCARPPPPPRPCPRTRARAGSGRTRSSGGRA